ncbi:MAG: formyltransferase family protein [Nanoarchaeota archaeon]|nr:formyltransferase family protein [Nanoarchaeota archaeon]
MLKPLHNPEDGQMRVAGLMSGSGTNLVEIIKTEKAYEKEFGKFPYAVVVIFSDTFDCNAARIGKEYDIPVVMRDKKGFYAKRNALLRDLEVRAEFDAENVRALAPYDATVAAYAGYMSIATAPLISAFLGINVHPADLSIKNEDGSRKYTGDNAVRDAILAGEHELRSTTHIIEPIVDGGRILMISSPLEVNFHEWFGYSPSKEEINQFFKDEPKKAEEITNVHQSRLKRIGDWVIFPNTLTYLAQGKYLQDERGALFFEDKHDSAQLQKIPDGYRID